MWVAGALLLLALHAALAIWGARSTSVTYDENFHVPAGVAYVRFRDGGVSPVNPPLVKALFGVAALAAGARPPSAASVATHDQRSVGEQFMQANAARYRHVYFAARLVSIALSIVVGLVVWREGRARFGDAGGWLGLALWALSPEALAHAGLATLDIATALLWLLAVAAAIALVRSGSRRDGLRFVAVAAAFAITRFTAILVIPLLAAVWLTERVRGRAAPLRRVAGPVIIAAIAMWGALCLADGGRIATQPLADGSFLSQRFQALQRAWPRARLPLPDNVMRGLDRQSYDAEPGHLTTYALGHTTTHSLWWYFPFAIAIKWPLGLLFATALSAALALAGRRARHPELWVGAVVFLVPAMLFGNLDAGVRYVLPLLPLACVVSGSLLASARRSRLVAATAVAALVSVGAETARAGPWWISHFNPLAGPPATRERLLNDSNVDWGQGLVALHDELARRHVGRVHLTYLGSADPRLYGIDFVPYLGGPPGGESDWLAVSSYFYVGLPQTVRLQQSASARIFVLDFGPLTPDHAAARPGDCMWLFKVR